MSDQPESIGRYRVIAPLGKGAMGVVYLAHDPDIDRRVALKVIRKDLLAGEDGKAYLSRFRNEVKAAGSCMHPNIVALYDYGIHEDSPYFVMEYVEAEGLDTMLAGGLGPQIGGDIVLQLLDALAFAHGMSIVHRDIKPANMLIKTGRRLKIMDFGISRVASRNLTSLGSVMGTPGYMSPEQLRGGAIDSRTDLFSAGAVLYEVIRGVRPIAGGSFEEVMARVLDPAPVPLAPADDILTEPMRAVVAKALAKSADERFQTAEEMADAVRAALGDSTAPRATGRAEVMTILAEAPPAPRPPDPDTLSGEGDQRLEAVKAALTVFLGPIAGTLVRRQARQTSSFQALLSALADKIDDLGARSDFLRRANEAVARIAAPARSGPSPPPAPASKDASPGEDAGAVEKALARHVGPIAKLLVKRALAEGGGPLRPRLAHHIEDGAARTAFLNGRG